MESRSSVERGLLSKTLQTDRNALMPQFIEAAMRGDSNLITQLLESSSIDVNQLDQESMSALHWASAYGD